MSQSDPPSRPALRKAVDATLHPALAGRATGYAGSGLKPTGKPAAGQSRQVRPNGKPLSKAKRSPTSDVLRPTKRDPAVTLKVTVPKSLRKKLRNRAAGLGVDPERLAAQLIAEGLD